MWTRDMGPKQRCQACALIGLAAVLGSYAHASEPQKVRIAADDGTWIGTLERSTQGDTLFLVQPDGNRIEAGTCGDSLLQKASSPSRSHVASVSLRKCGATVDFATQVILRESEQKVLIAVFEGRPRVQLRWRDDDHLEVHHSTLSEEQIYLQRPDALGVTAFFQMGLGATVPTVSLDYSNFNYGATSRAVGLSRECLLRIAGWCQEASGLHRPEWGTWSGKSPYGDDPPGRSKILDGVDYYEKRHPLKK